MVHEGQTYQSNPVTLACSALQSKIFYSSRSLLTSRPMCWETVTLTLDLSIRKLTANGAVLDADPFFREQPPHLQIPWFENLGDWKTTDLRTFAQPFLGQQRAGFYINDYRREGMFRSSLLPFTSAAPRVRRAPHPVGNWRILPINCRSSSGPSGLACRPVPCPGQGDSANAGGCARSCPPYGKIRQQQRAPLTVDIRPVPKRRPASASFSGAIGRFQAEVDANPKILRVGDPSA